MAQSRIAHSSDSLFSTGVPVRATLAADGNVRNERAVRDNGFFDVLRLVGDREPPEHLTENPMVLPHHAVRRQDDLIWSQVARRPPGSVVAAHRHVRREARDLPLPVPSNVAGQTTSVGPRPRPSR